MDEKLTTLKKWFRDNGISQVHIAKKTGLSPAYICQLFNGTYVFSLASAKKFHDAFGISIKWIMDGEGSMLDENFNGNIHQCNVDGDNIVGINNQNGDVDFKELIKQKDEQIEKMQKQIDNLIDIISKMQN